MESRPPFMTAIDISASGLRAQRIRMNAIASNVANINTTRTEEGGPYKRQVTILTSRTGKMLFNEAMADAKLKIAATDGSHLRPLKGRYEEIEVKGADGHNELDSAPPRMVFDPSHPDADKYGYVAMPNINIVTEMVNMISASRSYEANVTAIMAVKGMARKAMEI